MKKSYVFYREQIKSVENMKAQKAFEELNGLDNKVELFVTPYLTPRQYLHDKNNPVYKSFNNENPC